MIKKENIEKFYDYFDFVGNLLYTNYGKTYIEGINEAFSYLLDDEFEGEYSLEDVDLIYIEKDKVTDVSFQPEEVRKSVQLGLLKGYKHTFSSNALITPDTIGIFIGYLVKKLYVNKEITSLLDPLIGSGNLVYSIINYLEKDVKVYGVDEDLLKCNIARNLGDLMDVENEIFYQDTLTYFDQGFDLIVTDMPYVEDDKDYLPYQIINHHFQSLKAGGYFVGLIDNDFFEKNNSQVFREEIEKKGYIFGLIKLSETLFKNNPKSILILRRTDEVVEKRSDFLLVDLPSFNDIEGFNSTINQIDTWMLDRKDDL